MAAAATGLAVAAREVRATAERVLSASPTSPPLGGQFAAGSPSMRPRSIGCSTTPMKWSRRSGAAPALQSPRAMC